MKCFSCFSDITEKYNFHWYPLEYCSKCNLEFGYFLKLTVKDNIHFVEDIKNCKEIK